MPTIGDMMNNPAATSPRVVFRINLPKLRNNGIVATKNNK